MRSERTLFRGSICGGVVMGQSANDLISSWKLARYQEIKKLYNGGATRKDLIKRFGAQTVSNALDKTFRYQ